MLVALHGRPADPAVAHLDADDLTVEPALGDGLRGPLLALEGKGVLVLARHVTLLGHVLGGLPERDRPFLRHLRIREPPAERRIGRLGSRAGEGLLWLEHHPRRARHALDAARDEA